MKRRIQISCKRKCVDPPEPYTLLFHTPRITHQIHKIWSLGDMRWIHHYAVQLHYELLENIIWVLRHIHTAWEGERNGHRNLDWHNGKQRLLVTVSLSDKLWTFLYDVLRPINPSPVPCACTGFFPVRCEEAIILIMMVIRFLRLRRWFSLADLSKWKLQLIVQPVTKR